MPYFVTEDNAQLYYELNGKGPAVVLIHGWNCNRHHFDKQLGFLRERYQVLSYDLRGHGASERTNYGLASPQFAKDLNDIIEFCELKDVVVVGWSMGASVIFEYVRQYGCQNLSKICIIDMTPKMTTDDEWKLGAYGGYNADAILNDISTMAKSWDAMLEFSVDGFFGKKGYEEQKDNYDWAFKESKRNTPYLMINMCLAFIRNDYREEIKQISIPTLIAYGGASKMYAPEVSKYMNDCIPKSILMEFEDCGHALHIEEPERFNTALDDFIKNNV